MLKKFRMFFLVLSNFLMADLGQANTEAAHLAMLYAPMVFFHPGEMFFPCSVEWFLEHSRLVHIKVEEKEYGLGRVKPIVKPAEVIELIPQGQVKVEDLIKYNDREKALDLMGNRKTYKGMPLTNIGASPAPVYSKVVYNSPYKVAIQYWFHYAYNGPFSPLAITGRGPLGVHEGDWESIVVHLQKINDKWELMSVYLSRHGRERGEHINVYGQQGKEILQFHGGTHPIIYAAKYGHASYPRTFGLRPTIDGDLVDKGPYYWPTWENVLLIDDQTPWIPFRGRWGLLGGGPRGPQDKPLWKEYYPSDKVGKSTRQGKLNLLLEIPGIDPMASRKKAFNLDISTHFFQHCWGLMEQDSLGKWHPARGVDFDVMQKGFFRDSVLYRVVKGFGCFEPRAHALSGIYIRPHRPVEPGVVYKLSAYGVNP